MLPSQEFGFQQSRFAQVLRRQSLEFQQLQRFVVLPPSCFHQTETPTRAQRPPEWYLPKLKRKSLGGKNVDNAKLAKIEKELAQQAEENFTASGKKSTQKLITSIVDEASTSEKIAGVVQDIKKTATDDELSKRIVDNFSGYMERVQKGGKTNWRTIDESLDLGLSPRAYADTNFGIIALNAMRKVINAEKKFDVMSTEIIERQATKQGYEIGRAHVRTPVTSQSRMPSSA